MGESTEREKLHTCLDGAGMQCSMPIYWTNIPEMYQAINSVGTVNQF